MCYEKTNRQKVQTPVKHSRGYWCCNCDAELVHVGKKCDNCGAKPVRKKLKKETNAR